MNAKEKIQAAFDMIKEHVEKGGVLVSDEDGVKQYVFGSATLTTSSVGSHIWYVPSSHLPKIELWKGAKKAAIMRTWIGGEANTLYKLAQQYVKYCK